MPKRALRKRCKNKDWEEAQRLGGPTPGGGAGADEAAAALCREMGVDEMLPLHWAARNGAPTELIGAMLAVEAQTAAAKTKKGNLPLDLAVRNKAAPEVLDLLRKASPPPETLAVAIERQDWEAIGRLGLATPEACAGTDGEGYAALHWAQIKGAPPEVWEAIRAAGQLDDYARTTLVTTLTPCWYCAGLIRFLGIGAVIVGDTESWSDSGLTWLEGAGATTKRLHDQICVAMFERWAGDHAGWGDLPASVDGLPGPT